MENITQLRKKIFFLLLYVDPKTKNQFSNINTDEAITNVIDEVSGLNSTLEFKYPELVTTISLLESAKIKLVKGDCAFSSYRKLILDAGAKVKRLEEVI